MTEGTRKTILESVQEETDLGVVVRPDLKSTSQCNRAVAAARRIIAMVRRNFKKLDVEDSPHLQDLHPTASRVLYSVMVSTFDKDSGKSPEDSHKTDTTVLKAQL